MTSLALGVSFNNGIVSGVNKANSPFVRAVRGGS